jgi:hypothetical protein
MRSFSWLHCDQLVDFGIFININIFCSSGHVGKSGGLVRLAAMGFISLVQGVPFKTQPNNDHVLRHKNEIRSRSAPHVIDSPNLPRGTESRSPWLLGRCSLQLCKSCAGANIVYLRAECVFFLEYTVSK